MAEQRVEGAAATQEDVKNKATMPEASRNLVDQRASEKLNQ